MVAGRLTLDFLTSDAGVFGTLRKFLISNGGHGFLEVEF
jgi:hypothetical protein